MQLRSPGPGVGNLDLQIGKVKLGDLPLRVTHKYRVHREVRILYRLTDHIQRARDQHQLGPEERRKPWLHAIADEVILIVNPTVVQAYYVVNKDEIVCEVLLVVDS